MTRPTIKSINAALAPRQLELARGAGYFYFVATTDAPDDHVIPDSVYVYRLTELSKEEWLDLASGTLSDQMVRDAFMQESMDLALAPQSQIDRISEEEGFGDLAPRYEDCQEELRFMMAEARAEFC